MSNSTNASQLERFGSHLNCTDDITFIPTDSTSLPILALNLSIFALGFIGNLFTVAVISYSRKLHTPTFTMIACLAVSDAFSLFVCVLLYYTNAYVLLRLCSGMNKKLVGTLKHILDLQSRLNAGSQLCLLASLRYMAIANPLKFKIVCRSKRVVIMSVLGWLFVLISSASAVFIGAYIYVFNSDKQFCNIMLFMNVANFVIPTSVCITLHCLKLRALRQSPSLNNKSFARMNIVITLVVVIYILSSSAIFIDRAMVCYASHSLGVDKIVFLLNCAINPLIYFFISPPILNRFRKGCQSLVCTRNTSMEDNTNMHTIAA